MNAAINLANVYAQQGRHAQAARLLSFVTNKLAVPREDTRLVSVSARIAKGNLLRWSGNLVDADASLQSAVDDLELYEATITFRYARATTY